MGEFSPIHWLIVLAIILLLFGGRKIPELARGLGEGIRSFKEGIFILSRARRPFFVPNRYQKSTLERENLSLRAVATRQLTSHNSAIPG